MAVDISYDGALLHMFQTLNDHPLVTVAVFSDRAAAEVWLREG